MSVAKTGNTGWLLVGVIALLCAWAGTTSAQVVVQGPIVNPANGHVYYRLSSSTWSAAETFAVNTLGGHLVSISDAAENVFVRDTFANAPGSGRVWLGLNDAASEGTLVYTNGDPVTYFNWDPGEPNNTDDEDYVLMYSGNGRWNDVKNLANPPGIGNVYGVVEVGIEVEQGPTVNPANGHVYYRLSNSTWSAAEAFAVSVLGGHLVSINDAAENAFVLSTFANAPGSGRVWLGLNDAASEGTFVYTSGEPFTYSNWDSGEPNNSGNEDYVLMYSGNGRWNDVKDLVSPPQIGKVYGVVEGLPVLRIAGAQASEGNRGTVPMVFPVTISPAVPVAVNVDYATVDGTATVADGDYVPATGTLELEPGATEAAIVVQVRGDVHEELDEAFRIRLSNPAGALLAPGHAEAVGTIINDDGRKPDLAVEHLAHDVEGGQLTARVRNIGRLPAGATQVLFQDRSPARGGGGSEIATVSIGPLAADEAISVAARWTPGVGQQIVAAIADPAGAIDELTEQNNSVAIGLGVFGHRARIDSVWTKYGVAWEPRKFGRYAAEVKGAKERITVKVIDVDDDVTEVRFTFEIDGGSSEVVQGTRGGGEKRDEWSAEFDVGRMRRPSSGNSRTFTVTAFDAMGLESNTVTCELILGGLPEWLAGLAHSVGCDSTAAGSGGAVTGVRFEPGYAVMTLDLAFGGGDGAGTSPMCKPAASGKLPPEVPLFGGKETKVTHKVLLDVWIPFGNQLPWKGHGKYVYEKKVVGATVTRGPTIGGEIGLQIAPDGSAVDSLVIKFRAGYGFSLPTLEFPFAGVFYASVNANLALVFEAFVALTESFDHYYVRPSLTLGLTGNIAVGVNLRVAKGYFVLSPSVWATYGVEFGDQISFGDFHGGCAKMSAKVVATVGCRWYSWSYTFWEGKYGPWPLGGTGCQGVSGADGGWAAQGATAEGDSAFVPALFPYPSAVSSPAGRVGVVWVSDVGSDPENPDPEVFYVEQDTAGRWLDPRRLTQDEHYQSLAALAYLADGRPLAVWVQNSLTRSESGASLRFSEILDRQDLWYAIRGLDGTWATPAPVVEETAAPYRADGLPAAAAVGDGAMLVWARSAADTAMAAGASRIYFSRYGSEGWSAAAALTDEPADDTSPAVCGIGADSALAVWVRTDPAGLAGESLRWSLWDGNSWGAQSVLGEGTWRKQTPSLAQTRDGRALVAWVEIEPVPPDPGLPDTVVADTTFIHRLLAATFDPRAATWSAPEEVFADSHFVEAPVALVDGRNIAVVTWRGYNGPDGDLFISLRRLDEPGADWTLPHELKADPHETVPDTLTDWMASSALDGRNNLYAVSLKTDLDHGTAPAGAANFVRGLSLTSRGISGALDLTEPISGLDTPRSLTYDLQLAEHAVSVDEAGHSVGEAVTVTAVVKNIGDVISPMTSVRFFDGAPDSSGVAIPGSEVVVPAIEPDDSTAVSAPWTMAAGPHRIYAVAYPNPGVPEQSSRNNRAFAAVDVRAELAVDSVWVTDANPAPGAPDTIKARVRNLGGSRALGFELQFGGTRYAFDRRAGLGLAPQADTIVTAPFVVVGGVDTLYAQVDPDSLVADSDRSDNRAAAELRVLPDLAVAREAIGYNTGAGRVSAGVVNLGRVASGPFMVRFYDGDPLAGGAALDSVVVEDLAGGSDLPVSVPWQAPPGLRTVYVEADAVRAVEERDELNNETFEDVIVAGVPNLRVAEAGLRFQSHSGPAGILSATVRNTGNVNVFAVPVEFFIGAPGAGGSRLGDLLIPLLAAGDSAVATLPWTAPDQGASELFLVVDRAGTIAESDETDNRASLVFDYSAPVIAVPAEVVTEATGPDGAVVHFEVTAESPRCGVVPVTCIPPSGSTFPLGETAVLCQAECEGAAAESTFLVRVVDTTPPTLTCPAGVTVECSTAGGTPANDSQLAAFLAGATASDLVDPQPVVTWEAPVLLPVGTTQVRFTATDQAGNTSTCTAEVQVVDTTPPTIAVTLNRYVLWPANHKLADIQAQVSVTDICDANPTYALESVVSNEPANGIGDGDTAPDIVGAEIGTDDLSFQLRSERAAYRDGRDYTVTYAATDACGNHASASAVVRVPHDRGGGASPSLGFRPDGSGLNPDTPEFALVIYSAAEQTEEGIVAAGDMVPETSESWNLAEEQKVPALDAGQVVVAQAYVGNMKGVVVPRWSFLQDLNDDGLKDLTLVYPVAAALRLLAEPPEEAGPLGMHYETGTGENYLVPNVFALGPAVPFGSAVDDPMRGGSGGRGGLRTQGSGGAESGTGGNEPPPTATRVTGVYPNPFAGTVTTAFDLATGGRVRLAVYDARGMVVRTLVAETRAAGRYQAAWDGRSESGRRMPAGLYFVRFDAGEVRQTRKVVMMD